MKSVPTSFHTSMAEHRTGCLGVAMGQGGFHCRKHSEEQKGGEGKCKEGDVAVSWFMGLFCNKARDRPQGGDAFRQG